jgi:hypothetical protein
MIFRDRHHLRFAIDRGGGGKHHCFHSALPQCGEKRQLGGDVIGIIFQRLPHRFADFDRGGEIDHGPDSMLPDRPANRRAIGDGGGIKRPPAHEIRPAGRQIVEHHRQIASSSQHLAHMRADISGPAGNKNCFGHAISSR